MKVENPIFIIDWKSSDPEVGEVGCSQCPLNELGATACNEWMNSHRKDGARSGACPTAETYAEACRLAEEAP